MSRKKKSPCDQFAALKSISDVVNFMVNLGFVFSCRSSGVGVSHEDDRVDYEPLWGTFPSLKDAVNHFKEVLPDYLTYHPEPEHILMDDGGDVFIRQSSGPELFVSEDSEDQLLYNLDGSKPEFLAKYGEPGSPTFGWLFIKVPYHQLSFAELEDLFENMEGRGLMDCNDKMKYLQIYIDSIYDDEISDEVMSMINAAVEWNK